MSFWDELEKFVSNYETTIVAASSFFAALTAIVSIALTVLSVRAQAKHNRISIKPVGIFPIADYENEITLKLRNNGLGPLLVKDFEITSAGKVLETKNLVELMPKLPQGIYWDTFSRISPGQVVSSQGERVILSLTLEPEEQLALAHANDVRRRLGGLTLKCRYSDLYEKEVQTIESDLTWFLRRWED